MDLTACQSWVSGGTNYVTTEQNIFIKIFAIYTHTQGHPPTLAMGLHILSVDIKMHRRILKFLFSIEALYFQVNHTKEEINH